MLSHENKGIQQRKEFSHETNDKNMYQQETFNCRKLTNEPISLKPNLKQKSH